MRDSGHSMKWDFVKLKAQKKLSLPLQRLRGSYGIWSAFLKHLASKWDMSYCAFQRSWAFLTFSCAVAWVNGGFDMFYCCMYQQSKQTSRASRVTCFLFIKVRLRSVPEIGPPTSFVFRQLPHALRQCRWSSSPLSKRQERWRAHGPMESARDSWALCLETDYRLIWNSDPDVIDS